MRHLVRSAAAQIRGGVAEAVVCGCWDLVETSTLRSPLSSGVGSLGLIKMQGTGWQAAAAAYTHNPGRKGRRDGGGG